MHIDTKCIERLLTAYVKDCIRSEMEYTLAGFESELEDWAQHFAKRDE